MGHLQSEQAARAARLALEAEVQKDVSFINDPTQKKATKATPPTDVMCCQKRPRAPACKKRKLPSSSTSRTREPRVQNMPGKPGQRVCAWLHGDWVQGTCTSVATEQGPDKKAVTIMYVEYTTPSVDGPRHVSKRGRSTRRSTCRARSTQWSMWGRGLLGHHPTRTAPGTTAPLPPPAAGLFPPVRHKPTLVEVLARVLGLL